MLSKFKPTILPIDTRLDIWRVIAEYSKLKQNEFAYTEDCAGMGFFALDWFVVIRESLHIVCAKDFRWTMHQEANQTQIPLFLNLAIPTEIMSLSFCPHLNMHNILDVVS